MGDSTGDEAGFEVIWSEEHGCTVAVAAGELDRAAAPVMRRALAAAAERGGPLVVVDLSAVSFVDAAGVGALLNGGRKVAERGARLTLASPRPTVRRVLEMTDLDARLGVHDSVVDAVS